LRERSPGLPGLYTLKKCEKLEVEYMQLTIQQSYVLLAKHGVFAREICNRCGAVLGAVHFTRKDESGVWCSRECRGDGERRTIRKGGRPRRHMTDADRQRAYRANLRVTKPSRSLTETKDLQTQKWPLSYYPLTGPVSPCKQPLGERGVE
jgi:hypothetical protein